MSGPQWWCVWAALAASAWAGPVELGLFAPASFGLEAVVQLNDVTRKDRELGYQVRATLELTPVWAQGHEFLLHFHLVSPMLYLRGKHILADYMPYESIWDLYSDTSFYVHWKNGLILNTYLDPEEPLDVVNFKKSVASLFQVGAQDGAYNESDAAGACSVQYETLGGGVYRKVKRRCEQDGAAVTQARRVTRYTLRQDGRDAPAGLRALVADELLELGAPGLGLKARSWVHLTRHDAFAAPAAPAAHDDLSAALRALPAALQPLPLQLTAPPAHHDADESLTDEELVRSVLELDEALEDEDEGPARAAALLWRVVRGVRAADAARLGALLERGELGPRPAALCRALGLAGTRAAHEAAARALRLSAAEPARALALQYLGALALSPAPDAWTVREALRLGEAAREPAVARAALLAAGAGAAARAGAGDGPLADHVRAALELQLARCQEEQCAGAAVAALANMRRADSTELLLRQAERAQHPAAPLALDALDALPLGFAQLDRLADLALNDSAPLELRAVALDLAVRRRASLPAPLARLARHLQARGPDPAAHELRRVLWQRWAALAPHNDELRRLPRLLEPALRGWDAHAHAGTSHVLSRELGWAHGAWRAQLDSLQAARGGVLRRGAVTLRAHHAHGRAIDLLAVRVWARGLHALAGGGDAPDEPAEEPAAGLAFAAAGVLLPDVTLFEGQAELLGHVWAGTASAPTPALRALLPLAAERGAVRLTGGAVLEVRSDAALTLALDAQAQASLWYRSAHAQLELRAGAAAEVRAAVRVAWGEVRGAARALVAPRLRIAADLDFYSGVALCVRAHTAPHSLARSVHVQSQCGARRLRVSRAARSRVRAEGRTLALGRPNDAVCRTLRAHHADADADADADAAAA